MFKNEAKLQTILDSDPVASRCVSEVIAPNLEMWNLLKDDIMSFQREHFDLEEEDLIDAFKNPSATIVTIRDSETKKIVGFTYTEPVQQVYRENFHPERARLANTVYIQNTALDPKYMGHKLVGRLMDRLEEELIMKGCEYLERDALVVGNYAANIQKKYGDRVVLAMPHPSKWGDQIFFRIKLLPDEYLQVK